MQISLFIIPLLLVPGVLADGYVGGVPLSTVQSGTVSGGLYVDANLPLWGSFDVIKTFSPIPSVEYIRWARLYVAVYCGHMQNNYRGTVNVSFDGDGDGIFENDLGSEVLDTPGGYTYPGEGGNGPIIVNDHCNRVTSDYLMWYDVAPLITSQKPGARVMTVKTDPSFDGRIKMITLVIAYNDGDADKIHYWINQGHDVDSYLSDDAGMPYTGQSTFDLSGLSGTAGSAILTVNHMASSDGSYSWNGAPITTDPSGGNSQGAYFGYNTWNLTSLITSGESNVLSYDRTISFYKIPLATLTLEMTPAPADDLAVTQLNPQAGNIFAKEDNLIRISVKNNGPAQSPPTEVRLTSSDGFDGRGSVSAISPGQTVTVVVDDTSVRNLAGGTVTYTATVDPDDVISETDEQNNQKGITKTVLYNGYKGARFWEGKGDITTMRTFDLRGDLVSSFGDSVYQAGGVGGSGWSSCVVNWKSGDLPVPAGATIREARLYVPYCWDDSGQIPDHFIFSFNGNMLIPDSHYQDRSNFGGYVNHVYGLLVYNVTPWFNLTGNSASLSKDDPNTNVAMYGLTLAVVYEDRSASRKQVFLNEGFDILGADETRYATTPEEATAHVPFSGMSIVPSEVSHAILTTFVPSGNGPEGDLLWNGVVIGRDVWDYGQTTGPQVAVDTLNVESSLLAYENEGAIRSTAAGATPLMAASHVFLVIEYPDSVPTASFEARPLSGDVPLSVQFTDQSTGSVASYAWDFNNDGTVDSTSRNAPYTYTSPGTFTVKLTVTGPGGSDSEIKTNYITVTAALAPPDAAFTSNTTSGTAPLSVQFTDQSTGSVTSYVWDFTNDGTVDSTTRNASYTYTSAGTYTVKLTVTGPGGSDSEIKTNHITVTAAPVPPDAAFTSNTTRGTAPLSVQFTDQSTGNVTSYAWDFTNDGTVDSTLEYPSFTYTSPGTFTVKLTVSGPGGSDSKIKTNYLTVTAAPIPPDAAFTSNTTSGIAPLSVQFTDQSTGSVTSYAWDFTNDGTVDSTTRNASYTYTSAGTYTVKLSITGPGGSDSEVKTNLITVNGEFPPGGPYADFSAAPLSGSAPLIVRFTDRSDGTITSYHWDFTNDGRIDSTVRNPIHAYGTAGLYTVRLKVSGPDGNDEEIKENLITVKASSRPPVARFTQDRMFGFAPLTVRFTDRSLNRPMEYLWTFGDGTSSTEVNSTHTYTRSGYYRLTLKVSNTGGNSTATGFVYVLRSWRDFYF